MAGFAGRNSVHADQREPGQVMLKLNILSPTLLVVTVVAGFALLTAVGIVQAVTTVTVKLELIVIERPGMTFDASDLGMFVP